MDENQVQETDRTDDDSGFIPDGKLWPSVPVLILFALIFAAMLPSPGQRTANARAGARDLTAEQQIIERADAVGGDLSARQQRVEQAEHFAKAGR